MCYSKDFWSWMGANSGQIQILIAVIALLLAIIPIRHAYQQFKLSNIQRAFELKINLYNLMTENIQLINQSYEKFSEIIKEYTIVIAELRRRNDPELNKHEALLERVIKVHSDIEINATDLTDTAKLLKNNAISMNKLETNLEIVSGIMVDAAGFINQAMGIATEIETLKKAKGI
ncbi:hypothetical protein RFH39_00260 [Acinetobacter baumannii]|uniref:hypothetical protein n=1 Tax=Acinetobacter baumannii TaxID=470 RepID=UPI00233E8DF4|nr:hypothetical protein [Acinetobacter baumannii]MDC5518339.1 hypothetical protein [Acinetobacter baumannii]MDQ8916712.1 hypothetical protein [Acinetobacter baumannii]MDQ8947666.1 hypothetical protein [Acinetobacter baumannii]MDQ8961834.1 hypothetical protein [Acinetobacter baumannii]MDQ8965731.1 hypothetical protein [Acinetobacter baumannii]